MRLFCQIVNTVNVPFRNVKNKKKLGKKGFTTQFRGHLRIGQKLMVNRVMNIESVTNSIEHVTFKRSQKKLGKKSFRNAKKDSEISLEDLYLKALAKMEMRPLFGI